MWFYIIAISCVDYLCMISSNDFGTVVLVEFLYFVCQQILNPPYQFLTGSLMNRTTMIMKRTSSPSCMMISLVKVNGLTMMTIPKTSDLSFVKPNHLRVCVQKMIVILLSEHVKEIC